MDATAANLRHSTSLVRSLELPVSAALRLATLVALAALTASATAKPVDDSPEARVARVLESTPLVDGHNDLPWQLRKLYKGDPVAAHLESDQTTLPHTKGAATLMTDLPRLHAGGVGGQFWSVWIPATLTGPAAIQMTIEEIDITKRMVAAYPNDLELAFTAADVRRIHKAHRIASLIGIEGGHQIGGSLAALRQFYDLGARYMTLTHTATTDWADSATDAPRHHGLTPFGVEVVHEMNRVGMLIDLSHVSPDVMRQALKTTAAPVIFSHSSARALVDHPRNVPDDVLKMLAVTGGVVMVNFVTGYDSAAVQRWEADHAAERMRYNSPPYGGLYIGQPERADAAMAAWEAAHPKPAVTMDEVIAHIEHVRDVAGIDHVGLGSDFDGIDDTPIGLEHVGRFRALLVALAQRGWSEADLAKLAGENVLAVMSRAEAVAKTLRASRPVAIGALENVAE